MRGSRLLILLASLGTCCGDGSENAGECQTTVPGEISAGHYILPEIPSKQEFCMDSKGIPIGTPYTYHIAGNVPDEYHPAIAAGVESWNAVFFEKIGFDLFQPADDNPNWIVEGTIIDEPGDRMMGITQPPEHTMIIMHRDISPLANRLRRNIRYFASLVPQSQVDFDHISDQALIEMTIQGVMAHEAGHILGLSHNFLASADVDNYGDGVASSSVMDYGLSPFFAITPGPYDQATVNHHYFVLAADQEFLYWGAESEDGFNLFANLHDIGQDPLEFQRHKLKGLFADYGTYFAMTESLQSSYLEELTSAVFMFWKLVSDANPSREYALAAWAVFGDYLINADDLLLSVMLSGEIFDEVRQSFEFANVGADIANNLDAIRQTLEQRQCGNASKALVYLVSELRK